MTTNTSTPLNPSNEQLLRVGQVCARVGVSKTTWWAWVQSGKAPKAIKLSPGITVWRKADIDSFIVSLIEGAAQ